jgi:hypothetical protein
MLTVSTARVKVFERVRQMPAPRNRRDDQRQFGLILAQHTLCDVEGTRDAAVLLGVTKRTAQRWRAGSRAPRRRNLNKIMALGEIMFRAE